jgi:hypothetical protein
LQAQFHWGKAPPAAEPRIFTCISASLQPGIDAGGNFARTARGAPRAASLGNWTLCGQDDRTCNLPAIWVSAKDSASLSFLLAFVAISPHTSRTRSTRVQPSRPPPLFFRNSASWFGDFSRAVGSR